VGCWARTGQTISRSAGLFESCEIHASAELSIELRNPSCSAHRATASSQRIRGSLSWSGILGGDDSLPVGGSRFLVIFLGTPSIASGGHRRAQSADLAWRCRQPPAPRATTRSRRSPPVHSGLHSVRRPHQGICAQYPVLPEWAEHPSSGRSQRRQRSEISLPATSHPWSC
jgi:hypothetical protein